MRLKRLLVLVVCVLMVGALLPATAGATFYSSRYTSADAVWSSWDWEQGEPGPDDAIQDWWVSGFTSSGVAKDAGMPAMGMKDTFGSVWMNGYAPASGDDPETWTEFNCFAVTPDLVLAFGKQLTSANMSFIAEGTISEWYDSEPWIEIEPGEWEIREPDYTFTQMVSVEADWRAAGPITRSSYANKERSADFFFMDRSHSAARTAAADVSVVGADGTSYLVGPMDDGWISDYKAVSRFPNMPME